ncbi:hypothetical protein RDV89_11710 [Nocardioides zeae]|uniref:Uncharacterized protein n=1 Tax=Nocardioides imazamoxiresistens TaxID=3231893 RepID=A0ABU3PWY0_9ACTN|nr:hypothetical protein [Nocardioides zeae]MDT9593738.1 hypothetical protein [Nocardioides zeae]
MSYSIVVQVRALVVDPLPDWVAAYLEGITGDDRSSVVARPPEDDPDAEEWAALPEGGWFVGARCGFDRGLYDGTRWFWMSADFHDDFVGQDLLLFLLLAGVSAQDQVLGSSWIDEEPGRVTSYTARERQLFETESGGWRDVHGEHAGAEPVVEPPVEHLSGGHAEGQREGLLAHGAAADALAHHEAVVGPRVPTYARHLLARSVARVLAEHRAPDALVPVLRVLDAGEDPLAAPAAPGWEVRETWPRHRGRRTSSRVLSGDLAGSGAALRGSDLVAAPFRFAVGMRLRTRIDTVLRDRYRRDPVPVGAGTVLVVVRAFDAGHAFVAVEGTQEELTSVQPIEMGVVYDQA